MIFVTGGCSFSHTDVSMFKTWNELTTDHFYKEGNINVHTGKDAFGNDLISKSMMFSINQMQKNYPDERIVAMVMWSGISRKALVTRDDDDYINKNTMRDIEKEAFPGMSVPSLQNIQADGNVTEDVGYIYFTPSHAELSKPIKMLYNCTNPVNDWEYTTTHMLGLQHYCNSVGVELYWCNWNNEWDQVYNDRIKGAYSVSWLYDLLNHDNRITDAGMANWCKEQNDEWCTNDGIHPNQKSHIDFAEKVVIPFINNKIN